jgi:hypothetical protein
MWNRRQFLLGGTGAILGLTGGPVGRADDDDNRLPDGKASQGMINADAQKAIDQGLAYLVRNQHDDGSFGTVHHKGNVAITSLGALALMAGGHQPGRGPHGRSVQRALQFVLDQESSYLPGYLSKRKLVLNPHDGPMYGHGFGTLFLAEAHGVCLKKDLRDRVHGALKRAVDVIINSQNHKGGWRYLPERKEADISVTVCQIMALRAAKNAGISVPKEVIDNCTRYVKSCQEGPGSKDAGGFRYMDQGGQPAFARTAAGVVALYCAGLYKDQAVENGLKYLMQFKPKSYYTRPDMHYFYGHYYAVQAMWTAGGTYWSEWYPAIRDELIFRAYRMREHGYWTDQVCPHYATAMACIILQMPNNYLPILQK